MDHKSAGSLKSVYLERYAYPHTLLTAPPSPNVEMIVTIPSYREDSLIGCLESLKNCVIPPGIQIEVIVLINEPEQATPDVIKKNQDCYEEASEWAEANATDALRFFILHHSLPQKHAGVGLARKIIMDEAVRRFESLHKPNGIILCYDADCTCDPTYLKAVYDFFIHHPNAPGASIYFEHPLSGNEDDDLYQAITDYELFLRYYVNALRYTGFPHAFETIGSSMAVRSAAYQKQGGMNRRKAGEDFYFLHRIIPLGNFGEVNTTRVIPSPRTSDRVPFGTGRAVNQWLTQQTLTTYDLTIFEELKVLIDHVPRLHSCSDQYAIIDLPESVRAFLKTIEFEPELNKIRRNSASPETFVKQFFQWFDGFKVLKFVHFARDHYYSNRPIQEVSAQLLSKLGNHNYPITAKALLLAYRELDRNREIQS